MKGKLFRALLAVGVCTQVLPGQNPQIPPATGTGIVEGLVTRAGSSDPIPNVKVSLAGGPFDPAALQRLLSTFAARGVTVSPPVGGQAEERFLQTLADAAAARGVSPLNPDIRDSLEQFRTANNSRFSATSDDTGHFAIKSVLPGRYTIHTQRDSFYEDNSDPALAEAITVIAAQTATANLSMLRGTTIAGRVTDSAGYPLANATVQAFPSSYLNGFPILQASNTRITDDLGEFRIFWLPAGEYLIAAQVQPTASATPTLAPGASTVSMVRSFYPGTTDVATAIPVVVRGEAQLTGIDIRVRPMQTYRISGEVRSNAIPANSAVPGRVQSGSASLMLAVRDPGVPEESGPTATSEVPLRLSGKQLAGTFEIKGVLPGAYDLRVSMSDLNPDGGGQGLLAFASIPIDVNQDLTGLSLEIFSNVRVRGTVTVDGHPPGQTPVRIALQVDGSAGKRPSYQGLAKRPVVANDQDGSFTIPGVAAGRFHVLAGPGLPPNFYIADVLQRGSVFDSGFEVGGETPDPLQVILRSGAGTIEGIVRGANGKPTPGATVVLVPPAARRQNHALFRTAISDSNGRFKLEGAAPGSYDLFAWQNMPDGAYFNNRFVSRFEDRARSVNVTEASRATIDLTALPAAGQ